MNQRKHELQRNDFAEWVETLIHHPKMPMAVGAVVAGFVVVFLGMWWFQSSSDSRSASWAAHFEAADRAQFDGAVEPLARHAVDKGDPLARSWSRQLAADTKLGEGLGLLFSERAAGEKAIEEAATGYQEVLSQNPAGSFIHGRAVFGHAIAMEALGKTTEALAGYQSIVDAGPDTALGRLAQAYIDNLKSVEAPEAFVERFVAHTPTLPTPPDFGGGLDPFGPVPPAPSGTGSGLRPLPDISFPAEPVDLIPPVVDPSGGTGTDETTPEGTDPDPAGTGEGTETTEPTTEEPTAPTGTPGEEPSTGETPSAESPSEPPATDPPATDPPATDPPATDPPANEPSDPSNGEPSGQ